MHIPGTHDETKRCSSYMADYDTKFCRQVDPSEAKAKPGFIAMMVLVVLVKVVAFPRTHN